MDCLGCNYFPSSLATDVSPLPCLDRWIVSTDVPPLYVHLAPTAFADQPGDGIAASARIPEKLGEIGVV